MPPHALPAPVVIGGWIAPYGVIRSLGEAGVRSIVVDDRHHPGSFSRYLRGRWRSSGGSSPTPETVDALLGAARGVRPRPVLFQFSEPWALAILDRRAEFEQRFRLLLGADDTVRLTASKTAMHEWCAANGVLAPAGEVFRAGDDWGGFLRSAGERLPVILKPECKGSPKAPPGFSSRVFTSKDELLNWGREFGAAGPDSDFLAQRALPGPASNIIAFHGYRNAAGQTWMVGLTKLRVHPPPSGNQTSAALIRADADARDLALDVLAKLNHSGLFDIEFMRDGAGGPLHFIELNPRAGVPIYAATAAGINVPWLAWADRAGLPLGPPRIIIDTPLMWLGLETEIRAVMRSLFRRGDAGLARWCRSLRSHPRVWADLDPHDPRPGAATVVRQGLRMLYQALRKSRRGG